MLKEGAVGLMNMSDSSTGVYKMKLNLCELKEFTLYEGEIIVAEGFYS